MYFIFVVAVASLGGLLFGFDTGVISGALLFIAKDFHLSPSLQGLVAGAVLVGAVIGASSGGSLTDRFGRKPVIIVMAGVFVIGSAVAAASTGVAMLLAARCTLGVAIGVASMLTPLYLSEVSPAAKRGAVVSLNQVCITIGILASYLVDYAFADVTGTWRWMLGCGAVPGAILGGGMAFLPESPRWLASKGRVGEARRVLARLHPRVDAEAEMAELRDGIGQERGGIPLGAMLRTRAARLPLAVGVGLAVSQQVTGINTVIYYAPAIFREAGLGSNSTAILATVGVGTVNVLMTLIALLLIDRIGRRTLLLSGLAVMTACLVVLTLAFVSGSAALGLVTVLALACYVGGFAIGLGPVFWLMIAEIFPLAYRGRGMSVASVANWGANLVVALVFLDLVRLLTPGGTFALFAALSVASLVFVFVLVPETKGRSLEQIERDLAADTVAA